MNHFEALDACAKARNKALEDGRKPAVFHISSAFEATLRRHPMILSDKGSGPLSHLFGADVVLHDTYDEKPHLVTEDHATYFIDVPSTPSVAPTTRLRFDIRVTGEYTPDPAAFGGVTDPARWSAMEEDTILRNLPQFVAALPSIAPEAEATVTVEPITETGPGVEYALARLLSDSETTEDVFDALIDLLDAWRQSARGPGAGREFSHAISRLEEAQWRFSRGKEKAGA